MLARPKNTGTWGVNTTTGKPKSHALKSNLAPRGYTF